MEKKSGNRRNSKRTVIATLIGLASAQNGWGVDLANSPPGTVEPYVAPNVIITLDDSTSMDETMRNSAGVSLGPRTTVLKNAVISVFRDTALLPDGKIRMAWQTMGNCTKVNGVKWAPTLSATSGTNKNVMRPLDATHRGNFLQYMENYDACTNTPTHDMVKAADEYMRAPLHANGPWAFKPGTTASPYLGCRRNYHILLTDGGWNGSERTTSPRNYDGATRPLPDGTSYSTTAAQTRIYRDAEDYTTIADWAMKSWADPLQTSGLEGQVTPTAEYRKAPQTETFTNRVSGTTATLDKYWNPNNNPATWPHMVTYTIGFSSDALPDTNYNSAGTNRGAITSPTSMLPYGTDGNFADYANGTYVWRAQGKDKGHDMWHAALNGRGRFFAVEKPEDLAGAFRSIVQQINTDTEPGKSSAATSGSTATRNDVGLFTASYDPTLAWKGWITGQSITTSGGTVAIAGWQGNNTADRIDAVAPNDRVILGWRDANGTFSATGVPFRWASNGSRLSPAHKALLNGSDSKGEDRLAYLRGDRTKEGAGTPVTYSATRPFRQRRSAQGDIVNSQVWYVAGAVSNYALPGYAAFNRAQRDRIPMIYAGGNDGMLHGFSAVDGTEKIAYVPRGVVPSLTRLTDQNYDSNHRYFVDGSPMTGDVDIAGATASDGTYTPGWRTMLVGTLGSGGKGYFVLNVTTPGSTSSSGTASNFAEANAADIVVLDRTLHASETLACVTTAPAAGQTACTSVPEADIGHIFAPPVRDESNLLQTTQIARLNNNRWAVIMGNGYNSVNQRPVLLIQYLDGDKELVRLPAVANTLVTGVDSNATDNGLAAPRLVDINTDGRPDVVYAGDNKGNLWKFIIASADPSAWGVAFGGSPLFTATGAPAGGGTRNRAQSISAPPTVRANDRLKVVGTGAAARSVAVGGMMVAFGTGRNIGRTDPESTTPETLYSVLDNTRYRFVGAGTNQRVEVHPGCTNCNGGSAIPAPAALGTGIAAASLAQQVIGSTTYTGTGASVDRDFWTVNQTAAAGAPSVDWSTQNGWYLDLPQTGERILKPIDIYDGSNILAVYSQVPAKGSTNASATPEETCTVTSVDGERQYLTLINLMDGKRPQVQLMDKNGDGLYTSVDDGVSRMSVTAGAQTRVTRGNKVINQGSSGREDALARMPEEALRPSWRQLR